MICLSKDITKEEMDIVFNCCKQHSGGEEARKANASLFQHIILFGRDIFEFLFQDGRRCWVRSSYYYKDVLNEYTFVLAILDQFLSDFDPTTPSSPVAEKLHNDWYRFLQSYIEKRLKVATRVKLSLVQVTNREVLPITFIWDNREIDPDDFATSEAEFWLDYNFPAFPRWSYESCCNDKKGLEAAADMLTLVEDPYFGHVLKSFLSLWNMKSNLPFFLPYIKYFRSTYVKPCEDLQSILVSLSLIPPTKLWFSDKDIQRFPTYINRTLKYLLPFKKMNGEVQG